MIGRDGEAFSRRQLVVGVQRRSVTRGAAFSLEDLLSSLGTRVERVRVWRRSQRIHEKRKCIQLLVTVAALSRRSRECLAVGRISGDEAVMAGQDVTAGIDAAVHGRVAHEIANRTVLLKAGVVEISAVLDT